MCEFTKISTLNKINHKNTSFIKYISPMCEKILFLNKSDFNPEIWHLFLESISRPVASAQVTFQTLSEGGTS